MIKLMNADDVEVGMKIGAPLVNHEGDVLINSGETLEEKHLGLLKEWGIRYLSIVKEDDD
jgi:hypothetical protein